MRISFRVLLTVCLIIGVLPIGVSADPITDSDVSINFTIDGGDSGDLHDENGWLVAGSGIPSTVHVEYNGAMSPDIHFVRFTSVEKDTYGDVSESDVSAAPYETVFSASENVAGNAPIEVQINYTVDGTGYDYYKTVYQPIDHNTPITIQDLEFEDEITLGGVGTITMSMEDAYGNTVTSLYEDATGGMPEDVTFSTTSYAGSGFYNDTGYCADSVTVPVNAEGMVVAEFKAGTESGPKYLVHITPNVCVEDTWLTLTALANGEPETMVVSVNPNLDTPPQVSADGESRFYLIYHLFDRYGNPSGNQEVYFSNDVTDDTFTRWTNSDGDVKISFGPFDYNTTVTLHAEAVANPFVSVDQKLRFASTAPEGMYLIASPQSMRSADVGGPLDAQVIAKVTDGSGNGVSGETVKFKIIPPDMWDDAHQSDPYFGDTEGVTEATDTTNEDGFAVVNFTPGAFTCSGDESYSIAASESCDIRATWSTESQTVTLQWMNYPYLRVETEVSPETVEVGDTVDATVRLTGDGYRLYSAPVDVVLCVDRSGSMSDPILKSDGSSTTKMDALKAALKIFNAEMEGGSDRVGMVSFGTSATRELFFTTNRGKVDGAIDELKVGGWTAMRDGLYQSITEIIDNPNPRDDAVRAVIVLSDGDYNCYGDPLRRGSRPFFEFLWFKVEKPPEYNGIYYLVDWIIEKLDLGWDELKWADGTTDYYKMGNLSNEEQNMSVYAANHDIAIYSISYGDDLSEGVIDTLDTLATSTGGKYYHAPNATQLEEIYRSIAGELRVEAGVNTTMDLMFTDIERNNEIDENSPDNQILKYEFVDDLSTLIKSWNTPLSPQWSEDSDNIVRPLTLIDQTDDWVNENQQLSFDETEIGTLNLGQVWQTKFRLNVSKPGNINIFGDGSLITFNDGDEHMGLPKTYITAVLNVTGTDFTGLEVSDLICVEDANGEAIGNYLTMQWNLNYSGTHDVSQNLYYKKMGGSWTEFNEITVPGPVVSLQTSQLYVADFPPGEYKLRVRAMADDASESVVETSGVIEIGQDGMNYIRLG